MAGTSSGGWLGPSAAKLGRAKEHRDRLEQEIQRWLEAGPYTVTLHVDYEAAQYELRVRENERLDRTRCGLILGDALYNVRCTLDYLAYALSILETGQDPPPKAERIYFPLVEKADDWPAMRGSQIPDVGSKVQGAIETLQPYHGGDDETIRNRVGEHPLQLLRTLNNADKHRLPPLVTVRWGRLGIYSTDPGNWRGFTDAEPDDSSPLELMQGVSGLLEDGAVMHREAFKVTGPNPQVHMSAQITPAVVVEYASSTLIPPPGLGIEGPVRTLDHVVAGLDRILSFVEEEVFGRIARALVS